MRLLLIGAALISVAPGAEAAWTTWTNGHEYQVFRAPAGITWSGASANAAALGGYLVTFSSAAENNFVFGLANDPVYWSDYLGFRSIGPWIGLIQSAGANEPAGGWAWVTGEPLTYLNWAAGEPNNNGGNEGFGLLWALTAGGRAGTWNDFPNSGGGVDAKVYSYIVERVPSPGALPLVCGVVILGRRRRS